ncbi:MAG: zinc ribbon domain-containing protein [Burkholderiaceae bacterium]|nr:zinc ribbon domain-containing protein [Burkholderiaceae bacterium]
MTRKIPKPMVQAETAAYWQAADEGRLLVKRCTACGEFHHYPRDICPHCLSDATEWVEAAGTGTVYSFSTMGQGEAAYTLAYVTLDEGPTMLTNLVGAEAAVPAPAYAIGQKVRVVFAPSEGGPAVPMFTPA